MLPNRFPLTSEHRLSHLPISGIITHRIKWLFSVLALLVVSQTLLLAGVEDLTAFEAFYLTVTTLTTVGYGDFAPQTVPGRISTVVIMYGFGITMLTLIVSDFIEYRFYKRERILTGRWIYDMKDHIVIINTPHHGGERYFSRLASQLRAVPGYETIPIQILTQRFARGLPPELRDAGITHYHGSGSDPIALEAVHASDARHIILLAADEADPTSDSLSFDITHRLAESGLSDRVTVEVVSDDNRPRFKALGISTIIRPVRTYPEIMVRAVVSPGSEKVLEDLFNYQQDHPHRYEIELAELNWSDIVSALVRRGIGTALAYIDHEGEVVCHPGPTAAVAGKGLIVLVKSSETPEVEVLMEALEEYRGFIARWRAVQGDAEEQRQAEDAS